ncbi:ankyrin [Bimuria novae-zelandiae CBS 107.79]|uniref:Ankyrin n=1 Tax=Bimuria novae-zelandiae CBS 107.79 TaxID=1447943 RepID=A0A6A5UK06_9PLEO|nr:ankyrin [Bimuria novae-zelandiae CBS 107.79]
MAAPSTLLDVPVKHADFISYIESHPDTPLSELLEPYKQYDAKLREVFAQEPDHPALSDQHLNIVPVFNGHEQAVKIRARDLESETQEEKNRYIMPLSPEERRLNTSPAIVRDLKDFQQNFALFCESSLVDLDWSNVVAAGSSVVTCLLPVPEQYKTSKRSLRHYYHETIAPASDVDLFIYGLSEEEAIKKIVEIEKRIKDSILTETTTIRTKNAITIASQYPTRHIQIVLRIYKSVSEILTGFDVDCSCAAYDGNKSRLSKYSHRGFEVYWPLLERSRVDPTIFERNFARTVGLARLLVLERLPSRSEREAYTDERRRERGRPPVNRYRNFSMRDNIKDQYEDEVAEWVEQEDASDYHTFTIPYGPKYHAKKIEKLLDCCGFCPEPVTPEEHDFAEEEAKIYVSGKISFIKDNPGRQAIGSFNPITDNDWTEMAYVGNTARLCQAIVDEDIEHVVDWLEQEGSDPNCRDYTGRTPLHLAVTASSPEIVKALIDHGARLVARFADGRTALHLAAARGSVDMVRLIMQKSEENEEEESKKEDIRKKARMAAREAKSENGHQRPAALDEEDSDVDIVNKDEADSDDEARTTTTGSYVKVKEEKKLDDVVPEENEDDPDVYDVNELVQAFGADVLLPVKLLNAHDKSPKGAILTLVLSLNLPMEKAKEITKTLLSLGASSAQADTRQVTAFYYISNEVPALLDVLIRNGEPAMKRAINHLGVFGSSYSPSTRSPLMNAISRGDGLAALKLLECGATPTIDFKDWMKSVESQFETVARMSYEQNQNTFTQDVEQPIILSAHSELPEVAVRLLEMGVDPNTLTKTTKRNVQNKYFYNMESLLDIVQKKIVQLRADLGSFLDPAEPSKPRLNLKEGVDHLKDIERGSYKHFIAQIQVGRAETGDKQAMENYAKQIKSYNERRERPGWQEKAEAIEAMVKKFEELEQTLLSKGAKTFKEINPDIKSEERQTFNWGYNPREREPFDVKFKFLVHDLTDETREAYTKLFQAAWDNDLDTIKNLTMAPWGESNNVPLRISVQDEELNTVFGIAVLRGHWDLARALVDISYAQYQPPDEEPLKSRYRLGDEDGDDTSDMTDVPIHKELMDDKFMIDNIGELSTQVKSGVSPLGFMADEKQIACGIDNRKINVADKGGYKCTLGTWSLITGDKALFSFLLDLDVEWTDRLANKLDGSSGIPSLSGFDFQLAIEYGRIELLAEMIKHTGAGIELESLVKNSGVKYREKPKYYQGLSVHGKKRPAWINAARGTYSQNGTDSDPPLLSAAFQGSLQSVEWFLSDAPARHYLDFAEAYKHDKYIEHLNNNAGGFEKLLRKWLETRRELALHLAVMAEPRPESSKLVKYLIKIMPDSLRVRSTEGYTPLALAFALHRYSAAKMLIEAGADQTVRTSIGSNILDLLLVDPVSGSSINNKPSRHRMLSLIDTRLVPSLLTERTSVHPGSLTPIAHCMRRCSHGYIPREILDPLLDFAAPTNYECLELLDGSGDTPLHWAVKENHRHYVIAILDRRPDLLYRENSVGRTPLEMAEDAWLASCVRDAPRLHGSVQSVAARGDHTFAKDYTDSGELSTTEDIGRICKDYAAEKPGKRKLVSLLDANEVANRLAKWHMGRRSVEVVLKDDEGEAEEVQREPVEVSDWYMRAVKGNGKEDVEMVHRTV